MDQMPERQAVGEAFRVLPDWGGDVEDVEDVCVPEERTETVPCSGLSCPDWQVFHHDGEPFCCKNWRGYGLYARHYCLRGEIRRRGASMCPVTFGRVGGTPSTPPGYCACLSESGIETVPEVPGTRSPPWEGDPGRESVYECQRLEDACGRLALSTDPRDRDIHPDYLGLTERDCEILGVPLPDL